MLSIDLDIYQTAAMGALALALGLVLVRKSKTLRRFCIPAAVVGGLVFALVNCLLHSADIAEFDFDETLKNVFMMAFFCSVGFMASFRMLKQGGKLVVVLLALVSVLIVFQDVIGSALCTIFGLDPKMGLALGSISLVGGHGTAASYGEQLVNDFGIANADTVAIAAATFGLAFSGFIGGPLAKRRVEQGDLGPDQEDIQLQKEDESKVEVDNNRFLLALMLMVICIGAGTYIISAFKEVGITLPVYLGAMIVALVIRNAADHWNIDLPLREISALGWICLSMFLAMALMVTKLWQLADLAGKMVVILLVQAAVVAIFAYHVIFRCTGKNYESAALVTATCGFGLGATPNAVANMEALFGKYGVAPKAYFAVPLVGSVFIDLVNTAILTVFLNIL